MSAAASSSQLYRRVLMRDLRDFGTRALVAVGAKQSHAERTAEVLAVSDARGHPSHGMNRLEMYVDELARGVVDGQAEPDVVQRAAAVATVDGRNALGPVVGAFSMQEACSLAERSGIGMVVARCSNHYGMAAYYARIAAERGLIGLSMTNTSPIMVPTRAVRPALGTNPIAVMARSQADEMCLDMATTAVAVGKVEVADRAGRDIPRGWGVARGGIDSTNPAEVLDDGGGLRPLGGPEETSGYKGYGLALAVELLTGVLGGAKYGDHIRPWRAKIPDSAAANVGHTFLAIDPAAFGAREMFEERLDDQLHRLRGMATAADAKGSVLVPGDPERSAEADAAVRGVRMHESVVEALATLAKSVNIPMFDSVPER